MNRIMNAATKRLTMIGYIFAVSIVSLVIQGLSASTATAATTLPILWTAGGLSAGNTSVGNASGIAADQAGNIAVVSGPAF
ncbi:MAG: hypothetical protein IPP88_20670 [Betaproteobacteria bacterium]|nr:hypothetical protein [Betaproteobacteria bacterium]